MKIAHVITRLIVGGAQENTILTCEGLARRGHQVALIAGPQTGPEGSLWPRARRGDYETVTVDSLLRNVRPICDWRCARGLGNLFRERGFDIIHTHSSKAGILGRYAAHQAGVGRVVHTIHGMSFNRTQSAAARALYRALEKRAARWTDAFVCVADAMTDQAVRAGLAERTRFCTIRSGMETRLYKPDPAARKAVRSQWGTPDDAVVLGTVARLFRHKGYEQLLEALPRIVARGPNVRFVWIGDGAQRNEYTAALERMGQRDRVHLTGLVPPDDIPRVLCGMDLLVHASMWEGLPRAIVQAALTEVPAVSFDNDGAPEAIDDGVTGLLVPLADTAALAECVTALVQDSDRRRAMGAQARRNCLKEFDAERMVEQIDALYHRQEKVSG